MKNIKKIGYLFLLVGLISSSLIAQESDYEIKESFEENHARIKKGLDSANSVDIIDSLKKEVLILVERYQNHKELLDNGLYPSSYSFEVGLLQKEANIAEQRLLIIENQNDRLFKLSNDLSVFKKEIAKLNVRTDSLDKAIQNSQKSEEHLSALVKKYRKNLETRDKLIMNVIDSLMLTYNGISKSKIDELSSNSKSGKISGNENPLAMVELILSEKVEFTRYNTNVLSLEDHLRMYAVQHHFSSSWNQIGPQLLEAYGGNDKKEWQQSIDQKIKEWRISTSQKMWDSMAKYLEFSDVELGAFDNNYSFFVALNNFVKEAEQKSKDEILSSESYDEYKKFEKFWSQKIKNDWSNIIQDSELLTVSQISTIDEQLDNWGEKSRPIHPLLIVFLVITLISLLAFSFVQFKAKKG